MSQTAEKMLNAFERKVLRKIYGPVLVHEEWLDRENYEIYKLYKEMELIRNIRLRRLHWVSRVMRMKDEIVPNLALKGY
jgi:hypothetical protein